MKKQILVDMDGVLADTYAQHIAYEFNESGIMHDKWKLRGESEDEIFSYYLKNVNSEGFFKTIPLMSNAIEGLKFLNDKYNVLIVSSATEYPTCLNDKHYWLTKNFPFISWQQMIFCGRKDSIKGDIMIDDHIKNLSKFEGVKILFNQPHNKDVTDLNYKRVIDWVEIIQLLNY